MRQQSYLVRKGARYHFRRRIGHQATSRPISISLAAAEPDEARRLARRLAVKWDELEMTIEASSRSNLTFEGRAAIFRAGMEAELATAVGDLVAPRRFSDGQPGLQKVMAGAYSAILNVAADADGVPDEIVNEVTKPVSETTKHEARASLLRGMIEA